MRDAAPRDVTRVSSAPPGARWLAALAVLVFVAGAVAPLADMDLPIHLAVGEWIVHHRAVPWVEPFAWTRPGAPYYDYSWAPDVAYFSAWRAFGPLGLHLIGGLQLLASAVAVVWLGHVARWRPWTIFFVAWAQVWVTVAMSDYLRPQTLMLSLVAAAWALTILIARGPHPARSAVALYVVSAIAANSHFFVVLTALPMVVFITDLPERASFRALPWGRIVACACALALGWLSTPYVLAWPAIFRLNLTPNALLSLPSPIAELAPGFRGIDPADRARLAGIALALLPWAAVRVRMTTCARGVYAVLWLAGLISFGAVVRSLFIWWLAVIPLVAIVVDGVADGVTPFIGRATRVFATLWILAVAGRHWADGRDAWPREAGPGDAARTLPTPGAAIAEPALAQLARMVGPETKGKLLTIFGFGSYALWRLPGLAVSVDGRAVFPDSAAAPDAYWSSVHGPIPLGPWRSADVAIVPLTYPVASVLDTARGWERIPIATHAGPPGPWTPGLWVRSAWLRPNSAR